MGKPRLVAVIDIGSTAIRLVVIEVLADGTYQRVDRANRPVRLGRDVFMTRVIKRDTILQAITILSGFVELMKGWQVGEEDIFVIATSAIREARNRDTFIDRVLMKTGLKVRVVEGVEENHLTYIAVQHSVDGMYGSFSKANSLILEVGGGSIEVMVLKRGKMAATHSLKMGTIRIEQQMAPTVSQSGGEFPFEEYIREQFRVTMDGIDAETSIGRLRYFVMVGGDARIAAHNVGTSQGEAYWIIERNDFVNFVAQLQRWSVEEIVRSLGITYHEAENLQPALTVYKIFLEETNAEIIIVPNVSIREGVLLRYALGHDNNLNPQFASQVVASAQSLGKKYHSDEKHSQHVTGLALQLFDQLVAEHGLGKRERLYLEVAGILHDIGYFINPSGHHKHGQYIVQHSEIFGLSKNDIQIISNIVRYHRTTKPSNNHFEYSSLARDERLIVMKLSSILRVADALDRNHNQQISSVVCTIVDGDLILRVPFRGDLAVERYGLSRKGSLFEEIFGYRIVLEQE
ncbi:phosphatase [Spirochaeta lutea]|uniref:Phosphatase n=1 Tax=Spirochaeta lutea TaxID=1480694 RepID=A0A098QW47_9SPIO|nr:phosphatase [Spirochaeta lutea]